MIRAGIAGATGYTGYELIKILRRHPHVELVWLTSESSAGGRLSSVFPCPWDDELLPLEQALRTRLDEVDVVFLCLPHAASMTAVAQVLDGGVRAIDLSADFRLRDAGNYTRWYKVPHTHPHLLANAVYGLPELHRTAIAGAQLVANPGCYPTSVILGLAPLARAGLLQGRIIADSKSGVSGAGRGLKLGSHFVEVNENFSPYSIGRQHRHLAEMEEQLQAQTSGAGFHIVFSPHLLPVSRGILSTLYVELPAAVSGEELLALYHAQYATEPFIHLLPLHQVATLQHTVNTNRCAIGLSPQADGLLIVTSSIDNLLKGASGQAVQNLNVMFGWPETTGLV